MKKKVLFVVDERQMGGVSAVLEDLLHLLDHEKFDVDVLVLHDRGDRLQNLPANVRIFFGTPFFRAIDCSLKGALHNGDLGLLVHKLRLIFLMKTGRIAKKIMKERRKLLNSNYDVEVAFKDGFCALFSGYGDTPIKLPGCTVPIAMMIRLRTMHRCLKQCCRALLRSLRSLIRSNGSFRKFII